MASLGTGPNELIISVRGAPDVERARRAGRAMTCGLGFDLFDSERVVLAISELATNLARFAIAGELDLRPIAGVQVLGIYVESRDAGPGITDVVAATSGGASTAGGLGAGLAGVRRLMDDFDLTSGPSGTTVVCRKWRKVLA